MERRPDAEEPAANVSQAEPAASELAPLSPDVFDAPRPEKAVDDYRNAPPPARLVAAPPARPYAAPPFLGSERARSLSLLLAAIGVAVIAISLYVEVRRVSRNDRVERVHATFRATNCTIAGVHARRDGARWAADYEYRWMVSGIGYEGSGYAPDGPYRAEDEMHAREAFPTGSVVPCLYDPETPGIAYLHAGTERRNEPSFLPYGLGVAAAWFVAAIVLRARRT